MVIAVSVAVCKGGLIVPQAVIVIAIAAESTAKYIFVFIRKFSFLND